MNKLKAFTLAEVLLVVAIVGVVAILTVTNATNEGDEAERVVQLRRSLSIIESGIALATNEDGPIINWVYSNGNFFSGLQQRLLPRMKLTKNCGTASGCWKDGDKEINSNANYIKAILANGASIAIEEAPTLPIYIDVNGPKKGSTQPGVDVFGFELIDANNGFLRPMGADVDSDVNFRKFCGDDKLYCTAWVIKNGNMDYLKCLDELSWTAENGKTNCSN